MEEKLVGSNLIAFKTTLRDLQTFRKTLLLLKVLERPPTRPYFSVTMSHLIQSISNRSVGKCVTL